MLSLDLSPNTLAPGQVGALALDLIDPDPDNERGADAYLPELLGDLRTSLAAQGQVEPIQVYALPDGRYMNRTGHRRCAAARDLGWETIQALIVAPPADVVERSLSRIVSNLQRTDPDPIKLAISCQAILDAGTNQATLAKRMGHTQPWIANLLRLLALPAEAQALISAGKLTAAHGLELLRCDVDELNYDGTPTGKTAAAVCAMLADSAVKRGQSVKEVRAAVADYRQTQANRHKWAEDARKSAERVQASAAAADARRVAGKETDADRKRRERAEAEDRDAQVRAVAGGAAHATIARLVEPTADQPAGLDHLRAAALLMSDTVLGWRGEDKILGARAPLHAQILEATNADALHAILGRIVAANLRQGVMYRGDFYRQEGSGGAVASELWHLPAAVQTAQRAALEAAGLLDPTPAPTPTGDVAQ